MTKVTKIRAAKYFCSSLLIFLIFVILFLVFSGRLILPQFFQIGPLTVHYYGIILALAVAGAFYLAVKRASAYNIDRRTADDILFWTITGGFIGARLYHVFSSFGYYYQYPSETLKVWNGGLSIYGAVLGGIIVALIYTRLSTKHLALSTALDWLAPSVVLGQIIGRFGNLFNYEAYGYPTMLPWKMFVPPQFRPDLYQLSNFFHPWFLYEILGNCAILFLLLKIIKPKRPGVLVFWYVLLYNILRFGLEFLRIDSTFIAGYRLNAMTSLILVIVSAIALVAIHKKNVQTP